MNAIVATIRDPRHAEGRASSWTVEEVIGLARIGASGTSQGALEAEVWTGLKAICNYAYKRITMY